MSDDFEPLVLPGQMICSSDQLEEGGIGFRFRVKSSDVPDWVGTALHRADEIHPAFVILFNGQAFAYLNRCAHVSMEMDWMPGQFFTIDRAHLICATHDAQYLPDTGECISGPCPRGAKLIPIPITQNDGSIYFKTQT